MLTAAQVTLRRLLPAAALAAALPAAASSLQVAPTGLTFAGAEPAQAMWLTNTGSAELAAQVRVFRWTQAGGQDELEPTQAMLASPPMLRIAPGARQLVRVIRTGAAPAGVEQAYRVMVDELPPAPNEAPGGVQYVLRYSVPAFVAGPGATAAPDIAWKTAVGNGNLQLDASNHGGTHAQITAISMVAADGTPTDLTPGLLGYVLPGASMHWSVAIPAGIDSAGARIKAQVNGIPTDLPPPAGALPR
jgi:fimbrial chaperone protein